MHAESLASPPLAGLLRLGPGRRLPSGVVADDVHRFRVDERPGGFLANEELDGLREEAHALAEPDPWFEGEYAEAVEGLAPVTSGQTRLGRESRPP